MNEWDARAVPDAALYYLRTTVSMRLRLQHETMLVNCRDGHAHDLTRICYKSQCHGAKRARTWTPADLGPSSRLRSLTAQTAPSQLRP